MSTPAVDDPLRSARSSNTKSPSGSKASRDARATAIQHAEGTAPSAPPMRRARGALAPLEWRGALAWPLPLLASSGAPSPVRIARSEANERDRAVPIGAMARSPPDVHGAQSGPCLSTGALHTADCQIQFDTTGEERKKEKKKREKREKEKYTGRSSLAH